MRKVFKIAFIVLFIPIFILSILLVFGYINENNKSNDDLIKYPPPGKLLEINGSQLHLYASGERVDSQPTIVLEAGGGMCSPDWALIQPDLSTFTRVCSWDRPGYGWSEMTDYPRTSLVAAQELHELLIKNGEKPPFLLVGHSYGGHTIRIFASLFPEEVYGLVLLDARPSNMLEIPILKEIGSGQSGKLKLFSFLAKTGITRMIGKNMIPLSFQEKLTQYPHEICFRSKYFDSNISEAQNIGLSDEQARQYIFSIDIPIIVIRHGISDLFSILPLQDSMDAENYWTESQQSIADLSTNSLVLIAEQSGHNIHIEQPDLVIHSIKHMIESQ